MPATTIDQHYWRKIILTFLCMMIESTDYSIYSFSMKAIQEDFGLSTAQMGTIGTWSMIGLATGTFVGGWLCDRWGRLPVLSLGVIACSFFTALLGFAQGYMGFLLGRFLGDVAMAMVLVTCMTYLSESVPAQRRTLSMAMLMSGLTAGNVMAAFLANQLMQAQGWRVVYFVTALPIVLGIALPWLLPETPVWQALQRQSRAIKQQQQDFFAALKRPTLTRRIFIVWVLSCGCLQLAYYGVNLWMPYFLEKIMLVPYSLMTQYMMMFSVTMVIAAFVAGYSADKLGVHIVYFWAAIISAVCLPMMAYLSHTYNVLYFALIFGVFAGSSYKIMASYMTESFPGQFRGTAVGSVMTAGKSISVFGPILVGTLADQGSFKLGFMVLAVAYFLSGLVARFFIPSHLYEPTQATLETKQ